MMACFRRSYCTTRVAANALAEVLVRREDDDLLEGRIVVEHGCRAAKGVVGLEFDHRPHLHAHGGESLVEHRELGQQDRVDAFSRLVARPEVVAERLDDLVGGHADVGGPLFEEVVHRPQDPAGGTVGTGLRARLLGQAEVVAEQLVCPVDEMCLHAATPADGCPTLAHLPLVSRRRGGPRPAGATRRPSRGASRAGRRWPR